MIRFLFRFSATLALAAAVIMAVLDATRSIAASALVMTPLATSWAAASPETIAAAETFVRDRLDPLLWDPVAAAVLALPGFVVFAALALLLYAIGRKPARRRRGLALES
jgi:inosine-uridine nucleoside N-ribohydrolase